MSKPKLIKFTDRELEMLSLLKDVTGAGSLSAIIHDALYSYFKKVFPYYSRKKKDTKDFIEQKQEELTPEQKCEQAGGKVDKINEMCILPYGKFSHMKMKKPLSTL